MKLKLRSVIDADLPVFFSQQVDAEANFMAAFTRKEPGDRAAFDRHWGKIRSDPQVVIWTIEWEGKIAGHVATFVMFGEREVTYWIGKEFWGKGIATEALREFLREIEERPLFARAALDNLASIKVLTKCGFIGTAVERSFANGRSEEIDEAILRLDRRGNPSSSGETALRRLH